MEYGYKSTEDAECMGGRGKVAAVQKLVPQGLTMPCAGSKDSAGKGIAKFCFIWRVQPGNNP